MGLISKEIGSISTTGSLEPLSNRVPVVCLVLRRVHYEESTAASIT